LDRGKANKCIDNDKGGCLVILRFRDVVSGLASRLHPFLGFDQGPCLDTGDIRSESTGNATNYASRNSPSVWLIVHRDRGRCKGSEHAQIPNYLPLFSLAFLAWAWGLRIPKIDQLLRDLVVQNREGPGRTFSPKRKPVGSLYCGAPWDADREKVCGAARGPLRVHRTEDRKDCERGGIVGVVVGARWGGSRVTGSE